MSVLFLLTAPPPPLAGTDAVFQDVDAIRSAVGGEIGNLSPLTTSTRRFPKQLFGFHNLRAIRRLESRCSINHVFFSFPYAFPVMRLLRNPTFYTVTGSLDVDRRPPAHGQLCKLQRIIVSNERDAAVLKAWGLTNIAVIPPGIETAGLRPTPLPLARELTLLMASAPWSSSQFKSKGIDALLSACAALPFLRLILLWRGVLADEVLQRVERLGIGSRVEIVNRKVDINGYLARAHAAIVLASHGGLVRSFPRSLIEALVAGKPVLLSGTIAMADDVLSRRCGVVVPEVSLAAVTDAIGTLRRDYDSLSRNTAQIGPDTFSIDAMVESHRRLYGL